MDFNFDTGAIYGGIQSIDPTALPPLGGLPGTLTISGSGSILIPVGDTSQRPLTPTAGMVRFNSQTSSMEVYDGTMWGASAGTGTVTQIDTAVVGTGISVTGSPITSFGTLTFELGSTLQALDSISSTAGFLVQTATDVFTQRSIAGTSNNISVTNGDGVAANTVINLVAVSQAATGDFVKVTLDTFGRVTGNTPVVAADITTLVDATYVNVSGDAMMSAANLTFSGGGEVLGLPSIPSSDNAATSKYYVDSVTAGLSWKQAVLVSTTADVDLTTGGFLTIDGVTLVDGDRVLVKNQTLPEENGIYIAQEFAWVRSNDMNSTTPINEIDGAAVFVESGTTEAGTAWVQINNVVVLGTDPIVFTQFAGMGSYLAGTGLTLTGNTFSLSAPVITSLGGTGLTSIGTQYQVLGVNTAGTALEYKTIASGTGISIVPGTNILTINNTGVTSVGLSDLSTTPLYSISGSPVTTTGTLSLTLVSQSANTALLGPSSGTGQPTFRAIGYDDLPIKLYTENSVTPTSPIASGTNSVSIGSGSSATATGSFAEGDGSNARIFGQKAFANGKFSNAGDSQTGLYVLRNITTDATFTELFLDGVVGAQRLVLPINSVFMFDILVAARRTDAVGGGAAYRFVGAARKDATSASITFIGTPSKTVVGETNTPWDAQLSVDTVNGSIKLEGRGESSKTVRWVATVMTTEVTD